MAQRTVVFPITPSDNQPAGACNPLKAFAQTMVLYSKACKECVDVAWNMSRPTGSAVHKLTYYKLKEELGLKSQYLCSARNKAIEIVNSARALMKKRKRVCKPTVGSSLPFRLDARTLSFDKTMETASIATQLGRIKISLYWHRHAQRYASWGCKAGEVGIDGKGRWVLRLVFEKEIMKPERNNNVIGIDRGIKKPAVSSGNKFFGKRKWRDIERRHYSHIARLQSKGTRSARKCLKKKAGTLRRFKKDCDYIVAKEFCAALNPGDTLVYEKLTDIRDTCGIKGKAGKKHRKHMNRWSFKRLEHCINSVAEMHGIYTEYVDPRYTSQMCSRCGIVVKKNRKTQALYSCQCGLKINADLNAARNIAQKWRMATRPAFGPPVNRPTVALT